ncbi:radical SAM protein [Priestia megaterium]|nr:radical SAM protein [Priestia megaterium]
MKYDEKIYRPPLEANTLLLQVTSGCSNNNCTYCNMYKDVNFKTETLDQIEKDLLEARGYYPDAKRIYLLNGDPFILSAKRLKDIAKLVKKHLPECETITMYASIQSIALKTMEELKELKAAGINDLYIGLESGNDEVLDHVKKGYTANEAKKQLQRLNEAGIEFFSIIMYGIAGKGKGISNAVDTAALLSEVKSKSIFPMSTTLIPGTELHMEYLRGEFEEATEMERIIELKALIENLNVKDDTIISTLHASNSLTISGILPRDKKTFVDGLNDFIKNTDGEEFQRSVNRSAIRL